MAVARLLSGFGSEVREAGPRCFEAAAVRRETGREAERFSPFIIGSLIRSPRNCIRGRRGIISGRWNCQRIPYIAV